MESSSGTAVEIHKAGIAALISALGVADAARFLQQYGRFGARPRRRASSQARRGDGGRGGSRERLTDLGAFMSRSASGCVGRGRTGGRRVITAAPSDSSASTCSN